MGDRGVGDRPTIVIGVHVERVHYDLIFNDGSGGGVTSYSKHTGIHIWYITIHKHFLHFVTLQLNIFLKILLILHVRE